MDTVQRPYTDTWIRNWVCVLSCVPKNRIMDMANHTKYLKTS